jgi:hypothetical protein
MKIAVKIRAFFLFAARICSEKATKSGAQQ